MGHPEKMNSIFITVNGPEGICWDYRLYQIDSKEFQRGWLYKL